jgi:hypothetical protein
MWKKATVAKLQIMLLWYCSFANALSPALVPAGSG